MTEITPGYVFKLMRRWWWVMILCPVLAAGAAWLVTSRLTPIYEAEAVLLVDRTQTQGTFTNYNDILAAERLSNTYSELVQTSAVLTETVDRLDLGLKPSELSISVSTINDTQLLRITAKNADPELAALIANTVSVVFAEHINAQSTSAIGANSSSLQPAIDDLQVQIDETSARIDMLLESSDASNAAVQEEIRQLRNDLGTYQTQLADLLETQQRMALLEDEVGVQIRVADPASAPSTPISPRPLFNIALAVVLGFAVASGLVLWLGYLDDTVKTPEDVRQITDAPALGLIPVMKNPEQFEAMTNLRSEAAEAFRGLRTNLQFATLSSPIHSLVVTSSRPGEGKSVTASHLGLVLSQGGQEVILVDADLRRPQLHHLTGVPNAAGLTNVLLSNNVLDLESLLQKTDLKNLRLLTTGPLPPNPADLLNSRRMEELLQRLEAMADIVVIDTAPVGFSDPVILTGQTDGVIVVANSGETRSKELERTFDILRQTGKPVFGTVLNMVSPDIESYRREKYYRDYYDRDTDTPMIQDLETNELELRPRSQADLASD